MTLRNSDAEERSLERAVAADPRDAAAADRLLRFRARKGEALVEDVVLSVARRIGGRAPNMPWLVRYAEDVLGRRVGRGRVRQAIDLLYERDLIDARGALVRPEQNDEHRVLFTEREWVVFTNRNGRREQSGWMAGPSGGSSTWILYSYGSFGFDRDLPVRVADTLRRVLERKIGTFDEANLLAYEETHRPCRWCSIMYATVSHPIWYVCPNEALVGSRDAVFAETIEALKGLKRPTPERILSEHGRVVGWCDPETGEGYRGDSLLDSDTDRLLRRDWLLRVTKSLLDARPVDGSAWQKRLVENWHARIARDVVNQLTSSTP